jgi:Recombinase
MHHNNATPRRRYADGGIAIGELARWLSGLGVATRTSKPRWDRSTVWGMLRNPAYAGLACFGKTMRTDQTAGLNRIARLAGRATPRCYTVIDGPSLIFGNSRGGERGKQPVMTLMPVRRGLPP